MEVDLAPQHSEDFTDTDTGGEHEPAEIRVGACLSLSGRYARFGKQAANALAVWQSFDRNARLIIKDDASGPERLATLLPQVAEQVLGP